MQPRASRCTRSWPVVASTGLIDYYVWCQSFASMSWDMSCRQRADGYPLPDHLKKTELVTTIVTTPMVITTYRGRSASDHNIVESTHNAGCPSFWVVEAAVLTEP
jgi:hypothetical protein